MTAPPAAPPPLRLALFGTHPHQFNGYSKVVYELCKALVAGPGPAPEVHVFGFQNFYAHPGHRRDVADLPGVHLFDPHAQDEPQALGFGLGLVGAFVERVRPDVCVVFNDLSVLTRVVGQLHVAPTRAAFKVVAYVDQVYDHQRPEHIEQLNAQADAALAFTAEWRDCIVRQGLRLPCGVLPHGLNPDTYFPIPRPLARRYFPGLGLQGLRDDDFLVLNLNRNQPRKRWDTCLQAFAEVVARRPDAPIKLVIGTETQGAWDLLAIFRRELALRGVDAEAGMARIVVPGHAQMLTDVETNILYNIADVGVNTCDGEGFGLCNFEQAAVGVPQVVPRLGGFVHFFDDGNATLIDPDLSVYMDSGRDVVGGVAQLCRPSLFADAILRYYDDAALRARHSAQARADILQHTWQGCAEALRAFLRDVVLVGAGTAGTPSTNDATAGGGEEVEAALCELEGGAGPEAEEEGPGSGSGPEEGLGVGGCACGPDEGRGERGAGPEGAGPGAECPGPEKPEGACACELDAEGPGSGCEPFGDPLTPAHSIDLLDSCQSLALPNPSREELVAALQRIHLQVSRVLGCDLRINGVIKA